MLGWIAVAIAALEGVLDNAAVLPSLGLVLLASPMLSFCAAGIAQRGRLPIELVLYGSEMVFMWYSAGPLLAMISVGIPVAAMIGNLHQGLSVAQSASSAAFFLAFSLASGIFLLRRRQPKF